MLMRLESGAIASFASLIIASLDFELNDPNDPESVYTRSDHYSYAAKGIPIAFFTTGLHKDYHKVSDTVDKIVFPKIEGSVSSEAVFNTVGITGRIRGRKRGTRRPDFVVIDDSPEARTW